MALTALDADHDFADAGSGAAPPTLPAPEH